VTFGEEGSWVSMAVFFFLRKMVVVDLDLPLLLLPALFLKNLINGGGNLSVRPGLEMGLVCSFMLLCWSLFSNQTLCSVSYSCVLCFFVFLVAEKSLKRVRR